MYPVLSEGIVDSPDLLPKVAKLAASLLAAVCSIAGSLLAARQRLLWPSIKVVALLAALLLLVFHSGIHESWAIRALLFICLTPFIAQTAIEVGRTRTRVTAASESADQQARQPGSGVRTETSGEVDYLLGDTSAQVQRLGVRIAELLVHLERSEVLTGPAVSDAKTNVNTVLRLVGSGCVTSDRIVALDALVADTEQRVGADAVGHAVVTLLRDLVDAAT